MGMVVATEELSWGSLGIGGSLITRPEILTRALVYGGTEEQKKQWLPRAGHGRDPGRGRGDRARLRLRRGRHRDRRPRAVEGGWLVNGVKTWCTFAARADVLMLLARTDPDRSLAHRGTLHVRRREAARRRARVRLHPGGRSRGRRDSIRDVSRAAPSTPWAIGACTPTSSPSRTGSCPPPTWSAGRTASGRASTCRCRASRTVGSRPRPAPSASCRPPTRRPRPTPPNARSSARPSASTS